MCPEYSYCTKPIQFPLWRSLTFCLFLVHIRYSYTESSFGFIRWINWFIIFSPTSFCSFIITFFYLVRWHTTQSTIHLLKDIPFKAIIYWYKDSMLVNTKEHNKITITIIVIKISIEKSWIGKCSRLFFHLVRRQELINFLISLT